MESNGCPRAADFSEENHFDTVKLFDLESSDHFDKVTIEPKFTHGHYRTTIKMQT